MRSKGKTKRLAPILASLLLLLAGAAGISAFIGPTQAKAAESGAQRGLKDRIGVTNSGGLYEFNPSVSCMKDGADKVKAMGSDVIKLWLTDQFNEVYPYNTNWERFTLNTCVDLLKTDVYSEVLAMDFSTVILETYSFDKEAEVRVDWTDGVPAANGKPQTPGMTAAEKVQLENEMYEISKHLMLTYNGTGRQFVLQNWEGDNLFQVRRWRMDEASGLYGEYNPDTGEQLAAPSKAITDYVAIRTRALTDWFNARQAGVDRAMRELGGLSDVLVRHALEINFTCIEGDGAWPYPDTPYLLKTIVPYTDCDLYSYSCWSSRTIASAYSLDERLTKYQNAIGDTYFDVRDSNKEKSRRPFAREGQTTKVMLGEYGGPEMHQGSEQGATANELSAVTDRRQRQVVQIQTEIALRHNLEYIVYWELYCNVQLRGDRVNVLGGEQIYDNNLMEGNWLIRADGSFSQTYQYFLGLLLPEKAFTVDEAYSLGKTYTADNAAGGLELQTTMIRSDLPVNHGNRGYDSAVTVSHSADGVTFTNLPMLGYFDDAQAQGGKYVCKVKFINANPIPDTARYFRVAVSTGADAKISELSIDRVHVYERAPQRLLKLRINGEVGDEVLSQTKFVLGSGDTVRLLPEVTDAQFGGTFSFKTDNRYIASVDASGNVLGRTSGTAFITVTADGAALPAKLTQRVEIVVKVDGEVILEDSFTNIETIAFGNNGIKNPDDKLPNFGSHKFIGGAEQKFYETENIQFFRLDPAHTGLIAAYGNDPWNAYILDWEIPSGHLIYESEQDIGGYQLGLGSYGLNGLDSVEVFVSKDNKDYQKINSYVASSTDATMGYYNQVISNRQIIPAGMRFIKFKLTYTSANKWNPQIYGVKIQGAPSVNDEYIDSTAPEIAVSGSFAAAAKLGDVISLLPAVYSDDFCTADELVTSVRVFLELEGTRMEIEVKEGKFTVSAVGDYYITYKCEDLAGNPAIKEFKLTAGGKESEKGCAGCGSAVNGDSPFMIGFILAAAAGLCILVRRKKSAKSSIK